MVRTVILYSLKPILRLMHSTTYQLYDYFLTLGPEIELVWASHMNITKALYFATRYLAFSDTILAFYSEFSRLSFSVVQGLTGRSYRSFDPSPDVGGLQNFDRIGLL